MTATIAPDRHNDGLWFIGVVASAGGLEALRALLSDASTEIPAAWVIAQHMSPTHKSVLAKLLQRDTKLTVAELTSRLTPKRDSVYVVPPGHNVLLQDGQLVLEPSSGNKAAPKPSGNRLFRSLAEGVAERAIGVVLSGTGSDGAEGLQAIHEAGGLTIAQDPSTAKYDGMPRAALETECVDLILAPQDIAARLVGLSDPKITALKADAQSISAEPLDTILTKLVARKGVDFRAYKQSTIIRRVERRMAAVNAATIAAYAQYCSDQPAELDALFQDLLISVTRFFRDPGEFERLRPVLRDLANKPQELPIRIWSAGCATGEEAYTLAMLIVEALGGVEAIGQRKVQILATDIDSLALNQARNGRFERAALDDIPADLITEYMMVQDDVVHVKPFLKQMIIFSQHNAIRDPPFINLDLICCRNLLIYFENTLQAEVLNNFHYALNPDGALFLGTAESVSVSTDLFDPSGLGGNIFRKRAVDGVHRRRPNRLAPSIHRPLAQPAIKPESFQSPDYEVNGLVKAVISAMETPALLMNRDLQIQAVFGDATVFIRLREGSAPQMDHRLLIDPLAQDVQVLSTLARKTGMTQSGLPRSVDGRVSAVSVTVYPLTHPELSEDLVLVTFDDGTVADQGTALSSRITWQFDDDVSHELAKTQEALSETLEEWETATEELRALNQELQANNEELQAINEELETSNQELQSTNQELISVNETARIAHEEVDNLRLDLETILREVGIPLMIVNTDMQVTRISEAGEGVFAINEADRAHVSQVSLPEGCPVLAPIVERVIRDGMPALSSFVNAEREHTLSCRPVASQTGSIIGVSIMLLIDSASRDLAKE